jgi:hypothetical protein
MLYGAVGATYSNSTAVRHFDGSIHRIRLYNTALGGDLTGDLTGTQLGALKDEMLVPLPEYRTRLSQGKLSGIIGAPLRGRIG